MSSFKTYRDWNLGTGVVEMFQWKAALLIRAYIAGARTALAQLLRAWYLFEGACKVISQGAQVEEVRTWVNSWWIRKESGNSVVTNNSVHS